MIYNFNALQLHNTKVTSLALNAAASASAKFACKFIYIAATQLSVSKTQKKNYKK